MQNQTIYKPSQALIDNWKVWMAHEVVHQWQTVKTVAIPKFDPKEILDIDINIFSETFEGLQLKIQEQKSSTNGDDIESAAAEIKAWVKLEIKNLEKLREKLIYEGRDKLVKLGSQKINLQELLAVITKLNSSVQRNKTDLEEKKNNCIQREYSAWDAYTTLSRKMKLSENESLGLKNNLGVWRGLTVHFAAKLEAEIYSLYLRVLDNLQLQVQSLYDAAKSSAKFLVTIQQSLQKDASIRINSIPVFTYLDKLDANKQKDLMEVFIGHSINYWGRTPIISWQKVKEKLLSNIEPIAVEFCQDFVSSFLELEHSQINQNNVSKFSFKEKKN